MSTLSPEVAAALAAQMGIQPQGPLADVPAPADMPASPADVAAAAMPQLPPASVPQSNVPPQPVILPAEQVPFSSFEPVAPDYTSVHAQAPNVIQAPRPEDNQAFAQQLEAQQAAAAQAAKEAAEAEESQRQAAEASQLQKKENRAATQQVAAKTAIDAAVEAYENEKVLNAKKQADQAAQLVADGQTRGAKTLGEIMQNGSWGQRIGAALAVMAGGAAQGLLKLGSNPALDTINKMVEQEGEKRKLDMQQRKELREAALADSKFRLDELQQKVSNELTKANIAKMKADIDVELQKLHAVGQQDAQLQSAIQQGRNGELNDVVGLPAELRESAVRLPNGKYALAKNKKSAEVLDEYKASVDPALQSIDRILELSRNYTLLDRVNPADPKKRLIESELVGLTGSLRLPYTGPGQLLEKEYQRLRDAIGNPNKLLTLKSVELEAMRGIQGKLHSDRKEAYTRAGINLPQTRQEQLEAELVKRGVPAAEVKAAIRRKFGN